MKKLAAIFLSTLLLALVVSAQTPELTLGTGVTKHSGIDDVYRRFSEAYRTLNLDLIADQYTQTAAYLVPGDDILTGRENILPGFKGFFDSVRNNGQSMTISFDIVQRKVDRTMGYDVGIFTLRSFKDGKDISSMKGKFVVVAVKESDGKWRFQVDSYNALKPPAAR